MRYEIILILTLLPSLLTAQGLQKKIPGSNATIGNTIEKRVTGDASQGDSPEGGDPFSENNMGRFFFDASIAFFASDFFIYPAGDVSMGFKDITCGSFDALKMNAALKGRACGTFFKGGIEISLKALNFFSLSSGLDYYYNYSWRSQRRFTIRKRQLTSDETIYMHFNKGVDGAHGSPAVTLNPVLTFMQGRIMIENMMSFYFFNEMTFHHEHNMIVRKSFIWSPSCTAGVPCCGKLFFGIRGGGNVKLALDTRDRYSNRRYNAYAGPVIIYHSIFNMVNLMIHGAYWVYRSDMQTRFYVITALNIRF